MKKSLFLRGLSALLAVGVCFTLLMASSGCSLFISGSIQEVENTPIEGGWSMARVKDVSAQGADLSKTGYTYDDKWLTATVPGTVLTSYYNAGKIEDPYYSDNLEKLDQDYYNVDYWYRSEFTVPDSYKGRRVMLNFDGINWKADVFVNGQSVGSIDGTFIRGQFDVTDYVKVGETNAVAVYIHWSNSNDNAVMPGFLCAAGWDWMPPIPGRNMGIYKDVYLSASGGVTIDNPYVITDLNEPDYNSAKVTVTTELKNHTDRKVSGTIVGTIRAKTGDDKKVYKFSKGASVAAGETVTVDVAELTMKDPDLWWPHVLGNPDLYTMNIYFKAGKVSDSETFDFGVREYSYEYEEKKGENTPEDDVIVSVNGERVFCRGGNWGIPESMLNWTDKDFDNAVRLSKEEGLSMIRLWHGTSDFDAFYDACDKYGMLVCDEFWLNGSSGIDDKEMFMDNVEDKIKRLRNRACIAIWCGENEATPPDGLNIKIQVLLTDTKKVLDATRIYIPASNSGAFTGGITYQINDLGWYFSNGRNVGFTTEYGCVNIPNVESLRNFMPESELDLSDINSDNPIWAHHEADRDQFGNKQFDKYVNQIYSRYGAANSSTCKDIEDFARNAQLINYETFKAMFEAWNVGMFESTSGALLWMSHQGWPGVVWQTYDYYMDENGAFFGCRSANEPVHVQYNYDTGLVQVINNTVNSYEGGTVTAEVYNMDGSLVATESQTVNAAKTTATDSFNLFEGNLHLKNNNALSSVYFIRLKYTDKDGNLLSENNYWRGKQDQNYTALKDLGTAEYEFSTAREVGETSSKITLTVKNKSDKVAFATRIKLNRDNAAAGEDARVLPTFYSDNYFTLMPGESKTITMEYDNEYLCGGNPQLVVEGFNSGEYAFAVN